MNVTRLARLALVGASLTALAAGASIAATAPAKHKAARAAPAAASQVDPGAVAALARMSAYLRTIPSAEVTMNTERDEVDAYGQRLTFDGQTNYKIKPPNAFVINVSEGQHVRNYTYDGKSVTVFDPKSNYYARVNAPPTIQATLDMVESKYGFKVPLDDLFHWDQGDSQTSKLTAAHFVGKAKVNGQDTDQYVFRQPGIDWQIWITSGDKPTPLRVIIVASNDPARPQFEANLTWDTAPQFTADTFEFTPPAGAKLIPIVANGS